jgi:hypothetical protein
MNTPYLYDTSCYDCYNCADSNDSYCLSQCYRCNEVLAYNGMSYMPPALYYTPRNFSKANYFGGFYLPSINYF